MAARDGWIATGLAVAATVAFWLSPVLQITDSLYSMLLSEQLLVNRSFQLDEYFWPNVDSSTYPEVLPGKKIPRQVKFANGHLYHYFPHKQAILHAIGEHWLQEYSAALGRINAGQLENMGLVQFSERAVDRLLRVYKQQKGMLPLVHAMYAVPELRDLDEHHDELVVTEMAAMFARLGLSAGRAERERVARLWLEMTHALLLTIVEQRGVRANKSRADLIRLCHSLLENYQ